MALMRCVTADSQPGDKILAYLHDRGEALHITVAQPAKVVYIDWRDVSFTRAV
jgi:hypothetical protein